MFADQPIWRCDAGNTQAMLLPIAENCDAIFSRVKGHCSFPGFGAGSPIFLAARPRLRCCSRRHSIHSTHGIHSLPSPGWSIRRVFSLCVPLLRLAACDLRLQRCFFALRFPAPSCSLRLETSAYFPFSSCGGRGITYTSSRSRTLSLPTKKRTATRSVGTPVFSVSKT